MRTLYFDHAYGEAIRTGAKTSTIRCWKRRMVNSGETVKTNTRSVLFIELVKRIDLQDLTEEQARKDGFPDLQSLRERLHERYAQKNAPYYLIEFRFIS